MSDLILECELTFLNRADDQAEAVLELVEGGRAFQCRIRAATGDVELRISNQDKFRPVAAAAVVGAGPHKLRFANVDDQLIVWVNDKPLKFNASTNFLATNVAEAALNNPRELEPMTIDDDTEVPVLDTNMPKAQDLLSPAGIASRGVGLEVAQFRVLRDAYYVATNKSFDEFSRSMVIAGEPVASDYSDNVFADFAQRSLGLDFNAELKLHAFMTNVERDPTRFLKVRGVVFKLGADQFFMLGDNSPHSSDGRLWDSPEHYVKRELLIGKALFVYWPHGLPTVGGSSVDLPNLPVVGGSYYPNFKDMRIIR
ncbi:MAG: S26 family signal peptidase [Pirellulales bacterium]